MVVKNFVSVRLPFMSIVLYFLLATMVAAQGVDSTFRKLKAKEFIFPGILITTGFVSMLPGIQAEQKEWQQNHYEEFHTTADNVTQYIPDAAVLGLGLAGVKSKHKFVDRLAILAISDLIMAGTVLSLKGVVHERRPDGSTFDSFPSGHTANAFVGATILAEEYGETSIWYTIGGYTIASATGTMRMLNHRHWLSDVFEGAAIGVLSAKAAYVIYPWIKQKLGKHLPDNTSIVPMYDGRAAGVMVNINF